MTRYAVILSTEEYEHFSDTPFTHKDAELLTDTLVGQCDYAPQHVLTLKLTPAEHTAPAALLERIRDTTDSATDGDSILFYYAGHGHLSGDDGYLILPQTEFHNLESTALPLRDVSKLLRHPQRCCVRVFDACHSGVDVRDADRSLNSSAFLRALEVDPQGWVTLAACRADEYAVSDGSIGHGLFTHHLCEYVKGLSPGEDVLPELVRIGISRKVGAHAQRLGAQQTPTINAAISGDFSIATRRAETRSPDEDEGEEEERDDLDTRIAAIRALPDITESQILTKMLTTLSTETREQLQGVLRPEQEVKLGQPMSANYISEKMHKHIVQFVMQKGFQARHKLERWQDTYKEPLPLTTKAAVLSGMLQPRRRRETYYDISQSDSLPDSVLQIDVSGDGRCIADLEILVYILPLQLSICAMLCVFSEEWMPDGEASEIVGTFYRILKPEDGDDALKQLSRFAVEEISTRTRARIEKRVEQLERELAWQPDGERKS